MQGCKSSGICQDASTITLTLGSFWHADIFFFLYENHMDLCNELCSASWLAFVAKTLTLGIACTFQLLFFISAMIIGTIDFHHLIPLSMTLAFLGGHKVSSKQNRLAFIFSHAFQLIRMKFDMVLKQLQLYIPILLCMRFKETREIPAYCVKKTLRLACIQTFMNRFCSNLEWW